MSAARPRNPSTRQRVYDVISPYDESSGFAALSIGIDVFIVLCIVLSCLLILLEHLFPQYSGLFHHVELVITGIFVVEYLVRWYAAPNRLLYPFTFYALIDLLAILPTLFLLGVEMIMLRTVRAVRLLRVLRLLRLLRLLKFFRHGYLLRRGLMEARLWLYAVNYRYHLYRLGRLCVWLVLAWFIGANVVYLTETSIVGNEGPFGEYWKAYWHIIIVLISGIEDKEPLSLLGRIEVTMLMFAGICVVGMLTGEIVSILVSRMQRVGKVAVLPPGGRIEEHVLVLGDSPHLDAVVEQVYAGTQGKHFIVLVHPDAEERRAADPQIYHKVFALSGNPVDPSVLERAHVDHAYRVVVLADSKHKDKLQRDSRTLMEMLAVLCRKRQIPLVVELKRQASLSSAAHLESVEFVLSRQYGEKLISQAVINPGITEIFDDLLTFDDGSELYTVRVPKQLVGKSFAQAQLFCLDTEDAVVIGLDRSPESRPHSRFWLCPQAALPEPELQLEADDRLIVIAPEQPSFVEIDAEELWTGKVITRR